MRASSIILSLGTEGERAGVSRKLPAGKRLRKQIDNPQGKTNDQRGIKIKRPPQTLLQWLPAKEGLRKDHSDLRGRKMLP
jgi:hypothetical protein